MSANLPMLPTELRLQIWEYMCSEPRIVEVRHTDDRFLDETSPTCGYSFTARIPVVLHVCRESREVGLRHYHLDLRSAFPEENRTSPVYVNWQLDTLYLTDEMFDTIESFEDFCGRSGIEVAKIRHLAVNNFAWDTHCFVEIEQGDSKVMAILENFVSLDDFTLVLEEARHCGHGRGLVFPPGNLRSVFVEPDQNMRVIRGWSRFCDETVEDVRKLLREWESIWDRNIRVMAADRVQ